MYSAEENEMNTLFFGGIAQFYLENGERIRDDEVPFVKTIARVSRSSNGDMEEHVLDQELPAYLGTGAEFILAEDIPTYENGVIRLDDLPAADSLLVGYIYGGIQSEAANIFFVNDGTQSIATSGVFAVYLLGEETNAVETEVVEDGLALRLFPNPVKNSFTLEFDLPRAFDTIDLEIINAGGRTVLTTRLRDRLPGEQQYVWNATPDLSAGTYVLSLSSRGRLLGSTRFIYGD